MVWIDASAERTQQIRASKTKVFEFLLDVSRSGLLWPGSEKVEPLGELKFRWLMKPISALGISFQADYVIQYESNGRDLIRWSPVSGNLQARGSFELSESGGSVRLLYRISTKVDMPIPSLIKAPAKLVAYAELTRGLSAHAEAIRRTLEASP